MEDNDGYSEDTYTKGEMLLYKLDRTLAIVGLIVVGIVALNLKQNEVAMGVAGALAAYVGGKAVK